MSRLFPLFGKRRKRKERIASYLEKGQEETREPTPVPVLDDVFEEQSTGVIAQIRKTPLAFAEFIETQRTSLNKRRIFILEILDESVNAAIVARKGVFLDIDFLKSYSYETLRELYFRIVPDADRQQTELRSSVENIISIIAYDAVFTLPDSIVIIEHADSDLKEINIPTGRFEDEARINDMMMRELSAETGLGETEMVYSAIRRPFKKGDPAHTFTVSLAERRFYEGIETYLREAGFGLKKLHSVKSSLYASFALHGRESAMRIHIDGANAYVLYKTDTEGFEYLHFDLGRDLDDLQTIAQQMEEVILSGDGPFYERLKSLLLQEGVRVRWWNYAYDLRRCIIRLEKEVALTNRYANLIGTAYYELFGMRLSLVRLGVGKKLNAYEFMALNLNLFPVAIVVAVTLAMMVWYFYERSKANAIASVSKEYSTLFQRQKSLRQEIDRQKKNAANAEKKIATIRKILSDKIEIGDAAVLYEIARKLPDDMIITAIQKKRMRSKNKNVSEVIIVRGKCYLERSLLDYMRRLHFEGKSVYLVEIKDTMKTRFASSQEQNLQRIVEYLSARGAGTAAQKGAAGTPSDPKAPAAETRALLPDELFIPSEKVYYADTLNNSFTLEIR